MVDTGLLCHADHHYKLHAGPLLFGIYIVAEIRLLLTSGQSVIYESA